MLFAIKRDDPVLPYLGKLTQNPHTKDWSAAWTNELNSMSVYTGEEVAERLIRIGANITDITAGMQRMTKEYQVVPVADTEQEVEQCKHIRDGVQCRFSEGHPQDHQAMEQEEYDFTEDSDISPDVIKTAAAIGIRCPKCTGRMVERMNRKSGSKFFGCYQWPKCTGTRRMP